MIKEENFIIFSDIKRLFFKMKWVILAGAIVSGGLGLYKRSQGPVAHIVSAVFKEVGQSQMHFGGDRFSSFLQTIGVGGGALEGHALIRSSLVLEPVIESLGLQAEISTETKFEKKKRLCKESLNAERGRPIERLSGFVFKDVYYRGEYPKSYQIFFTSCESFEIREGKRPILKGGLVGHEVSFDGVTFTVESIPSTIKLRRTYPLSIAPLSQKLIECRKLFTVAFFQGEAALLSLEMKHADRQFAIGFLNKVMDVYKGYLERENRRVTEGQIAYLEKRRDDCFEKMNQHLKEHVSYLKENLGTKGVLNLGQQLPLFQSRKQDLSNDLMDIDFKLVELGNADPTVTMELGSDIEGLQNELHAIAKERDAFTLALFEEPSFENNLRGHVRRLDQIEQEELRVKTGIDTFFAALGGNLRQKDQVLIEVGEFGKILSPDATQLRKVQQEQQKLIHLARENTGLRLSSEFLKNQLRLLSLQEGTLKQRLFHGTARGDEYRGIGLETARNLLLSYLHGRDDAKSKIREMAFASEQIGKEDAEWVSLASVFPDTLCQEMVREMGGIKQQLRRERTLTEKERERLEKKCARMQEDLTRHIEQIVSLAQLEKVRNEDRIDSVRMAILDLLGQEYSLIEKQIEDRIEEKLIHLGREKSLVQTQLKNVQAEMMGIPDTWLREHRLKFASDMNKGMLEALVHLVESKSIEKNLSILESKPIDLALSPLNPKPPLLKVFGVVGAFLGALVTFAGCFIYYLYRGFPLTLRNLGVRGKKVLGPLKNLKDLEVYRRFSLLLKDEKKLPLVACLVLGNGENYTQPFAELLAKEGKKILVIDLDFKKKVKEKNLPGLIHFLEGEVNAPSIREKPYGDYIPMGGNTSFGDEILRTEKFENFLNDKKKEYDIIFLSLRAEVESSLPKSFFDHVDVMAIRLEDHPFSALEPYFAWEREGNSLAFV